MFTLILRSSLLCFLLIGCTSNQTLTNTDKRLMQNIDDRNQQLAKLNNWNIKGKIAFLQGKERDSASINWNYNQENNSQRLDLSHLFGINVFHLESKNNYHNIVFDGKKYHGNDLDKLIYSLNGLTLPTQALSYWLKGMPYLEQDALQYSEVTQLPTQLISNYNNKKWQVTYQGYQIINNHQLATEFTIRQSDLTIKIEINWTI